MSLFPIVVPSPSAVVTLSGHTITAGVDYPGNATAVVRIDDNGIMYQIDDQGLAQIDSSTDWVRPASAAPGPYQCRYTNYTGDPVQATASVDTWYSLSGGNFQVSVTQYGEGFQSATFDLQIRWGTGSVLASATYHLSAVVIRI